MDNSTHKILVVDDDYDARRILCTILEGEGFEPYEATNVEEAIEVLENNEIDLVLLDIRLGSESGFELCRKIRLNDSLYGIPIIAISVSQNEEDIVTAIESGASDFLSKPISHAILIAKIKAILRLRAEAERLKESQQALLRLIRETNQQKELLSKEADFSRELNRFLDADSKKDFIRKSFSSFLGARLFSIFIYHEDSNRFRLFVTNHPDLEEGLEIEPEKNSIMYDAFTNKKVIYVENFSKSKYKKLGSDKYETDVVCAVPLLSGDYLIGILTVNDPNYGEINGYDFEGRIIRIAGHLGVSLHNTILFEKVKDLSMRDPMTGLYNFRHFLETLRFEVERAKRYEESLSCIMIDIDNFKSINDRYGHQIGDEVLKELARSIVISVRASDIPARYGGDEFIILLPKTSKTLAMRLAKRLMDLFSDKPIRIPHDDLVVKVTLSIGIAAVPEDTLDVDELVKKADNALYEAKNRGKNRIVAYGET